MEAVLFVYEESRPVDYRAFSQWLFYTTPNLIRDRYGRSWEWHVLAAIELDLSVSPAMAEKLIGNAVRLGFVRKDHVHCEGYCYVPNVSRPQ